MASASTDTLKQAVFDRLAECHRSLQAGEPDMGGLDESVRSYCDALAQLPPDESRAHVPELEAMMKAVTQLGVELVRTRDAVKADLHALDRLRKANSAYQRLSTAGKKGSS